MAEENDMEEDGYDGLENVYSDSDDDFHDAPEQLLLHGKNYNVLKFGY